jgi:putative AlgH/UPF0301 family transcriptional regulator
MAQSRHVTGLYRYLFRLARNFDKNPAAKVLVFRSDSLVNRHIESSTEYFYIQVMDKLLRNKKFFTPDESTKNSFTDVVRSEFRAPNNDFSQTDRLDTGLAFLRKFSSLWKKYELDIKDKKTLFSGVNEVKKPSSMIFPPKFNELINLSFQEDNRLEPGSILISHPLLLDRSVILIVKNDDQGVYGLMMNHPLSRNVGDSILNFPDKFYQYFGDHSINYGGPNKRTQVIHNRKKCGGELIPILSSTSSSSSSSSTPVGSVFHSFTPPFYMSFDVKKTFAYLTSYPNQKKNFQFFVGCCLWETHKLQREIEQGFFLVGKSQPEKLITILKLQNSLNDLTTDSFDDININFKFRRDPAAEKEKEKEKEKEGSASGSLPSESSVWKKQQPTGSSVEEILKKDPSSSSSSTSPLPAHLKASLSSSLNAMESSNKVKLEQFLRDIDVYELLLKSNEKYAPFLELPHWVSAKEIRSSDWN